MVLFCRDEGRWNAYGAIARTGLIAAIVAIATSSALGQVQRSESRDRIGAQSANQTQHNPLLPFVKPPEPYVYPYSCKHPRNAEQDSLCAEREAAKSADKWGRISSEVGIFSAIGLFLTLLATAGAAIAAGISARAAEKAVQKSDELLAHSEEASERQLRAYLFVDQARIFSGTVEHPRWYASVSIKNGGQTPAYDVSSAIGIEGDGFPIRKEIPPIPPINIGAKTIIGPQGEITLSVDLLDKMSQERMEALRFGKAIIWVTLRVDYTDVFNQKQWITGRYFTGGDSGKELGALIPYHVGTAASEQGHYQRRRR